MSDQPAVYVPQGHIALREALARAAEIIRPAIDIRAVLSGSGEWWREGFDQLRDFATLDLEDDAARTSNEDEAAASWVIGVVRDQLRFCLAEGHITSVGQRADGRLDPVPQEFWRTDAGGRAILSPMPFDGFTRVFLTDKVFAKWVGDVPHWFEQQKIVEKVDQSGDVSPETYSLPSMALPRKRAQCKALLARNMTAKNAVVEAGKEFARPHVEAKLGFAVSNPVYDEAWGEAAEETGRETLKSGGRKSNSTMAAAKSATLID
ncbi:hypothetical protein HN018_02825 [Lichenicola cladoniae]|uniref:Uncharacterized protein n=1 Tax=Lichenicola cladoniae TaxID=1484109 RepID=A0A6M8HL91_9PROT|nr:hypothetical protein [Lichenicola cladoniae]NPD68931.1 hypothetical protein [Acetobacteraceae bacterium]QKE89123.1 hypothetical protein HN018_02825 [Lichenicola cladoniae]